MSRVLNHAQAMPPAHLQQSLAAIFFVHLRSLPTVVNNHHRLDLRMPVGGGLQDVRGEQVGPIFHIEQYGVRPEIAQHLRRGREGHGGNEHAIAPAYAHGLRGQMQG